jgi:hypothetical protein
MKRLIVNYNCVDKIYNNFNFVQWRIDERKFRQREPSLVSAIFYFFIKKAFCGKESRSVFFVFYGFQQEVAFLLTFIKQEQMSLEN